MSKRPAFQFYPADWRTEAGLRLCSMPARGLWIEMMCLMHDAVPYGYLTALGRPMTTEALARLVGEGVAPVKRWLAELEANEVFSRDEGVIFSRRMVRDEAIRDARAAGGPAGAEHGIKGASHGAKGGRPRKEKPPLPDTERGVLQPPPSSSSSSPSPIIEDVVVVERASASDDIVIPASDLDAGNFAKDLLSLTNEVCCAAGIRHIDPGAISRHIALVKGWIDEGFDPDESIMPAVREAVAKATDRINALQFFDRSIRQFHARKEANSNGFAPHAADAGPTNPMVRAIAARRAKRAAGAGDDDQLRISHGD